MNAGDRPGPTDDYSKRSVPLLALCAGAAFGALLLIAADFSSLIQIKVLTVTRERVTGHAQHDWALVVLGFAGLILAYGAARRAARPALAALAAIGLVVAIIALARDLPDTRSTGVLGQEYEEAHASPGPGFYMEVGGAALLLIGGGAGLALVSASGGRKPASRRRPRASEDGAPAG